MKVEVITRHAITNYGSLLQAIATQAIIEELGHECEIIDYIRHDESYREREKTLLKKKDEWNSNILKRAIYLALRQPESIFAGKKFEKQRKKYLKLSKQYSDRDSIYKDCPIADVYMTGSDQVWGPTEDGSYDDNYFLAFTENVRKIAYAASFGRTKFKNEILESIAINLSNYEKITVREDSAVKMLGNLGINAEQVIDPTLLFDRHFWDEIAVRPTGGGKKKYILVYQIHNDHKLSEYAREVANRRGLDLIRISAAFHQITRSGRLVWCPSIAEFLGYIRDAELMVTDSFHGTAFALNYNTPFVEVLPNNGTGTRNVSILSLTGLSNRILTDDNNKVDEQPIDFSFANKVLSKERERSKRILNEMIIGKSLDEDSMR